MDYRDIFYDPDTPIEVKYWGTPIRICKTKAINIADQILCTVTSIQNQISLFDLERMMTYLRHSGMPIGLLVNYDKSSLEINAISR